MLVLQAMPFLPVQGDNTRNLMSGASALSGRRWHAIMRSPTLPLRCRDWVAARFHYLVMRRSKRTTSMLWLLAIRLPRFHYQNPRRDRMWPPCPVAPEPMATSGCSTAPKHGYPMPVSLIFIPSSRAPTTPEVQKASAALLSKQAHPDSRSPNASIW